MAHSHVLDCPRLDSTSTAGEALGVHYPLVLDLESLSKCKLVVFFWERRSMKHLMLAHLRTGLALATKGHHHNVACVSHIPPVGRTLGRQFLFIASCWK